MRSLDKIAVGGAFVSLYSAASLFSPVIVLFAILTILASETKERRRFLILAQLKAFSWFCSKENRKVILAIIADLKKDAREMKRQRYHKLFISAVILWRSVVGGVIPILWDSVLRFLINLVPIARIIQGLRGLF